MIQIIENENGVAAKIASETTVAKAMEAAMEALKNPPAELERTITLKGGSAAKLHFVETILVALGIPQDEVGAYLLRSGAERELQRLSQSSSMESVGGKQGE